jgi:hypothetical protein
MGIRDSAAVRQAVKSVSLVRRRAGVVGRRLRERPLLTVLLAYSLLTVAFTYPVALNIARNPAGSPYFVWEVWWAQRSLVDLHMNLANVTSLYYPQGAYLPLLWTDLYTMVSALPLVLLCGPLVAYNLHFLATYVLTGFTTYLLCYHLTRRHWASFLGGMAFAFCSFRSHQAVHGHLNLMLTYWLPLYVLFLIKLFGRPSARNMVLCGIFLGLSVMSSPLHAAHFLIPCTVVFLAYETVADPGWLKNLRLVGGLAAAALVAIVWAGPLYVPLLMARAAGAVDYLSRHGVLAQSVDLLGFLVPSPSQPIVRSIPILSAPVDTLTPQSGYVPAYLGAVTLLLAVAAAWKVGRRLVLWWILTATGAVLAMGPLLQVHGEVVEQSVAGRMGLVVLPGALLTGLPFYDWIRGPDRFSELAMFGLAVLVAYGASVVLEAVRYRTVRWLMVGILTVLIPFELALYLPFPIPDMPIPDFYRALAADSEEYAILDIGSTWNHWGMYYQTVHRHPIVRGHSYRFPSEVKPYLAFMDQLVQPEPDIVNQGRITSVLNHLGIRYVVLQKLWLRPDIVREFIPFLTQAMGTPTYDDDQIAAFAVPVTEPAQRSPVIPYLLLGEQWHPIESVDGAPARWMVNDGTLFARVQQEGAYQLAFVAHPFREPRHLRIYVGDNLIAEYHVGGMQSYVTPAFTLKAGEWTPIRFHVPEGCEVPSEVMEGQEDQRCLSMMFQAVDVLPVEPGS